MSVVSDAVGDAEMAFWAEIYAAIEARQKHGEDSAEYEVALERMKYAKRLYENLKQGAEKS